MNLGSPDPKFKLGLKTHRNDFRGNVMKNQAGQHWKYAKRGRDATGLPPGKERGA